MILLRPPNDEFTFDLFEKFKSICDRPADWVYLWSVGLRNYAPTKYLINNQEVELGRDQLLGHLSQNFKHDLVIFAIKDHLCSWQFNPKDHTEPDMVCALRDFFIDHSDRTFILITSLENLSNYLDLPNVKIVNWGGDITNQRYQYSTVNPVIDKKFDQGKSFISLNRIFREHRVILLSLIYGLNLDQFGLISSIFKSSFMSNPGFPWHRELLLNQEIQEICEIGHSRFLKLEQSINYIPDIYDGKADNDNVNNFQKNLSELYCRVPIEIIAETTFSEKYYLLTEKTLNSIYGCSFPILISGVGAVSLLRNMGMDLFDDVIDHSYDSEPHPTLRLWKAIQLNKHLLSNPTLAQQKWSESRDRFLKNADWANTQMYKYYQNRALAQFTAALQS